MHRSNVRCAPHFDIRPHAKKTLVTTTAPQAAAAAAVAVAPSASAPSSPPPLGLYGLSEDLVKQKANLLYISGNASVTTVGPPFPASWQEGQQLSALDGATGTLYTLVFDILAKAPRFVGISLATGAVVSNVPAPFHEDPFIGLGQAVAWDPSSARIIAGGQDANLTHVIGFIDPATGAWEQVAALNASLTDVFSAGTAYIPTINALAYQLRTGNAVEIYVVDMATGRVAEVDQSYGAGAGNLETMDYDPVTDTVYGLSVIVLPNNTLARAVSALHPHNLTITLVGLVPGFASEYEGIGAVDVAGRSLWWVGQKSGAAPTDPAWLIQSSLADGGVVSAAEFCSPSAVFGCPWSMAFLNAAPPAPADAGSGHGRMDA